MSRTAAVAGLAMALVATAALAQKEWWEAALSNGAELRKVERGLEGTGIVQYDDGTVTEIRSAQFPYEFLGNLFDTRNGVPLSPGSISGVSWYQGRAVYLGEGKGSNPVLIAGFPTGTGSPFIYGITLGATEYAFNAVTFPPYPAPTPFVVAIFAESIEGGPPFRGSIGLASGTTNGQGFHGLQRSFFGSYSGSVPSRNAIVRVTGSVIVPVELMEFDLD